MSGSERQRPAHEGPGEDQIVLAGSNVSETSLPVNYLDYGAAINCPMACSLERRQCPFECPIALGEVTA
jgi:hypothetical protein